MSQIVSSFDISLRTFINRIKLDHYRLPVARFSSLWVHPEFCLVVGNDRLAFPFTGR